MCQGSRWRCDINENVKNFEPDKQYDAWLCFFLFFIYISFLYILFQKSKIMITKNKKQTQNDTDMKRTSHFQFCLTMSFKKQSSLFFILLVLNLNQDSFVYFTIKGRELPCSLYLFSYFFLLSPLLANNKSLSSSHLKWI